MAAIRCKACGKLYVYEKEGCCPGCGAYNRPPKRERVNPDGTIQHMTDAAYAKRKAAAGKVCFEEKECHEEKVCYEDQTRHGKRKSGSYTDHGEKTRASVKTRATVGAAQVLNQLGNSRRSSRKGSKGRSLIGVLLAVIIAIAGATNVLDRVFNNIFHDDEPTIDVVSDPGAEYSYDAVMGEELTMTDGSVFTVKSWTEDDRAETITVDMAAAFADSSHDFYATLLCVDGDNDEITLDELTTSWSDPKTLRLQFKGTGYKELKPFALILDEWEGDDSVDTRWVDLR